MGVGLLYDFIPQSSIFTLLSPVSSYLDPLLLGQAISALVFLLVLISVVPIDDDDDDDDDNNNNNNNNNNNSITLKQLFVINVETRQS